MPMFFMHWERGKVTGRISSAILTLWEGCENVPRVETTRRGKMPKFEPGVNIIGRDKCPPCKELKQLLDEGGVPYHHVDFFEDLSKPEQAQVRWMIRLVSAIGAATLPAVVIVVPGGQIWMTNEDGDVTPAMLRDRIQAHLTRVHS